MASSAVWGEARNDIIEGSMNERLSLSDACKPGSSEKLLYIFDLMSDTHLVGVLCTMDMVLATSTYRRHLVGIGFSR